MVEEFGARAFSPWPGDFENYDIFNARSQEFAWPDMNEDEFRSFLMFVAHNLHIHDNEKMTIKGWTFAALVAMEGADNIAPERVADAMRELQRATT
jgi:hypothetical protein